MTTAKQTTNIANFHFYDFQPQADDLAEDAIRGLSQQPKALPPKLLYDDKGAELFVRIVQQPEYYIPQLEQHILAAHLPEINELLGEQIDLIEPGAGDCMKVRQLLANNDQIRSYVPLEISGPILHDTARDVARQYPGVDVHAVAADYLNGFRLPATVSPRGSNRVIFFPGSSIGNYPPEGSLAVLRSLHELLEGQGHLLIGVDTRKDPAKLLAAYNDAAGITAAFELNVIDHLDRELGLGISSNDFTYEPCWNEAAGCIEMRIAARYPLQFTIRGHRFRLSQGETIYTESSYKYPPAAFCELAQQAGFRGHRVWTDAQGHYAVHYFEA
jgi:dimethylhistidine N-methyltransferase